MRIGELARRAGVGVETVRYYQRIGLLPLPEKPYGGTRTYGGDDLRQLRFIRRAQLPVQRGLRRRKDRHALGACVAEMWALKAFHAAQDQAPTDDTCCP